MNPQENISTQLKRRTHLLDRVIDNLLPNMYPCDYNSSDHFVEGVLDEMRWFLVDVEELQGVERMDIENYILDYKYDEITNYFNERCGDTKKDNLQESIRKILKEETNPIMRRIFRRVDPEKMDKIFGDGLDTMMIRYHQNKHNWTNMNLDKFKSAIVSYVIVDLCIKYSEICFGAEEYYNKVWEFLLNNYSDVMEEKWKEIVSGEINESIEDGKKVYYGFQGLPNFWANDQDNVKGDKYFEDKNYEDYYFDNFYDMDAQFGNENSLFGTRGLPVGHPDRSSKSFNRYNEKYGPIIVRVVKETL
jgi:hypothetical protein